MDILGFLDGVSPWWWVAGALALGIIEVLTFSFFLIWPALAALTVAVLMWIFPEMTGAVQLALFAALAIGYTLIGRRMVMERRADEAPSGLNNRAAQLIGRSVELSEDIEPGVLATLDIDGVRWRGRLEDGAAAVRVGHTVYVADADGMTLVLSRRL